MSKLNIGRIPIMKGEFVVGKTYNRLWQVTCLGSTYQSRIDNNTSSPAEWVNGAVVHKNTDKWLCIADATEAVNHTTTLYQEITRATTAENEIKKNLEAKTSDLQSQVNDNKKNIGSNQQQITDNKSAQDEKNTSYDKSIASLDNKTGQLEETIKGISVSGGASVATAVTYDNSKSGMTAINAQNAIDELAAKSKEADERIVQELGDNKDKVVSQFALPLREVENESYLHYYVDAKGNFLGGITKSGAWDIPAGIPEEARVLLESLQKQVDDIVEKRDNVYTIESNDNYLLAIIDQDKHFLGGITKAGKWIIPEGISEEAQKYINDINKALKSLNEYVDSKDSSLEGKIEGLNTSLDNAVAERKAIITPKDEPSHILGALVDAKGNELWSVDKEGNFNIANNFSSAAGYSTKVVDSVEGNLYTIVDQNNKIIFNITKDRKIQAVEGIDFGDDLKTRISILDSHNWLFAIVDANGNVAGGIDKYGAIFANSIKGVYEAKQVENDEWLLAFRDANERIAFGVRRDGSFFANSVQIDGIPSQIESDSFLYVITDKDNKVLWGIMNSGAVYQPYGVPEEVKDLARKLDERIDTLNDYLTVHGVQTKVDFSDSSYIQIPEPRCAVINITGFSSMPTSKTANYCGYLEFWDMQGNYFKKKVIANAQGNSSMGFIKKNAAFDFCDDDWIGDETPSIRFGKWVPQDSFHMKAYYTDFFRGVGAVSYKLYDQIVRTRGNRKDRPWKKGLINFDSIKATTNSFANPLQDDFALEFDTGARCFPDGFPVICYLNGNFYGVFSWQLKKHRDNMHQDKKTAEHIHIDGNLYSGNIWQGSVAWNQFEIRNPKSLYCINTEDVSGWGYTSLDATADADEIAAIGDNYQEVEDKPSDFTNADIISKYGNNPPAYLYRTSKGKWYKLITLDGKQYLPYDGDNPVELIDDTMPYYDASNKDHVRSNQVKIYLKNLSTAVSKMQAAETIYNTSSKTAEDLATLKAVIETYCDVENQIDYMIVSDLIKNSDGFGKNWQWFTYDGVKWYVGLYDCDMSFGGHFQGNQITTPLTGHISTTKSNFHGYVIAYYAEELNARYKELADMGIITVDNIYSIFKDWTERIGVENYKKEYKKWADSPCYGQSTIRTDYWEMLYNEDGSPKMVSSSTYNSSTVYAVDDEVSYGLNSTMGYYCFKCIQATETAIPAPISYFRHTDNIYRVQKWIETEVVNMDKVYGYTRQ